MSTPGGGADRVCVGLDVKLHDIPTQVGRTARRLGELGVDLLTVHATGGAAMMANAVDGLRGGDELEGAA